MLTHSRLGKYRPGPDFIELYRSEPIALLDLTEAWWQTTYALADGWTVNMRPSQGEAHDLHAACALIQTVADVLLPSIDTASLAEVVEHVQAMAGIPLPGLLESRRAVPPSTEVLEIALRRTRTTLDQIDRAAIALGASSSPNAAPTRVAFALQPPRTLIWDGASHELPPQQWQLLNCFWPDTRSRTIDDLAERVTDRNAQFPEKAVQRALTRLSKSLLSIGANGAFDLHVRSGWVVNDGPGVRVTEK